MKNEKIAYASAFCSHLLENIENIKSIILFGSASRGEAKEDSDIDIFVDTVFPKDEKKIKKVTDSFFETQTFKSWRLKGISNTISVIVGNIESEEWRDLKRSIMTDGIILYGKYIAKPDKLKQHVLFSYTDVKDANKRVNLHRRLFGYSLGKRHYDGIVTKVGGIRHGRGSFSVPIENFKIVRDAFKEMKVTPRMIEIWME